MTPPIIGTFTGNSTAKITAFIKVQLPSSHDKLKKLHMDWKSPYNVLGDMIRNQVSVGVRAVSPLFTPEEAFVDKRPQFQFEARNVMEIGEFETYTEEHRLTGINADSNQTQKVVRFRTVKDSTENIVLVGGERRRVVKRSIFTEYDFIILQLDIRSFEFDDATQKLIAAKKESEQSRIASRAKAEAATQEAITIKAQADAAVARSEGDARVQLIKEVTEARKAFEVAQFAAKEAEEKAKKTIAEGRADAEIARLKVAAGLTPLEKATIEKEKAIGVATAFAAWKPPTVVMSGGSGGGASALDPLMINQFLQVVDRLNK
jgi:hypothetical protein